VRNFIDLARSLLKQGDLMSGAPYGIGAIAVLSFGDKDLVNVAIAHGV